MAADANLTAATTDAVPFTMATWFEDIKFEFSGNAMTYLEEHLNTDGQYGGNNQTNRNWMNLNFTRNGGVAAPTADQAGSIKITATDIFGKEHSWTVPFTLKFNQ